jgi:hypothetical protein
MCKFKSFILLKNGDILHNDFIQSHEDLITLFNINDNSNLSCRNFVRCEFVPQPDSNGVIHYDKPKTYKLIIDEQHCPDWVEGLKEQTIERMQSIIKSYVIKDAKILVGKFAIITGIVDKVLESSIVYITKNGKVTENNGTVTYNDGTVTNNYGTVTKNYGTVTENNGTVTENNGTVTDNYGTVTYNNGTVTKNNGTVIDNYGTVTDNYGTVIE